MINTAKLEKLFIKYAGGQERVERIFEHCVETGLGAAGAKEEIFRVMPKHLKLRLLSLEGQLPDHERGNWLADFSEQYRNPLKHLSKKTIRKMEARL